MDIEAWLQGLGLERYITAFRDNEINWAVLPKLTADDLKDIHVAAVGHRRMLLEAIAALGASTRPRRHRLRQPRMYRLLPRPSGGKA